MFDDTYQFMIVDDLFTRYTIFVGLLTKTTSVYCDECEMWVFQVDGDHLSTHTQLELFEYIVSRHDEQIHGTLVEIADISKALSNWQE